MLQKGKDIKLNVRPLLVTVYHEYVFEGPCRFSKGEGLTKEFDLMDIVRKEKEYTADLQKNLGDVDFINLLPTVVVKRDETFPITNEILEHMGQGDEDIDLYMVMFHPFGIDLVTAFAMKYNKPVATVLQCCNDTGMTAALRPRGYEAHGWANWEDAINGMKVLRARKAVRNTRILAVPRANSNNSVSCMDSFYRHDMVTEKLGVEFRYYNLHEFLDQTREVDPYSNPTLPGRKGLNITEEDAAEIKTMTEEFMANADECDMTYEDVYPTIKAHYFVNKLLDHMECNAFAAPCPDMCATRRLNQERFTLCCNHSLNNEKGICSACEYDLAACVSMVMLTNLSFSPAYMGNTSIGRVPGLDTLAVSPLLTFNEESYNAASEAMKAADSIAYTFHATPNRKMEGFDAELAPYAIRPFAMDGRWGATIRYDFNRDKGKTVTMCRIDPSCSKIFVARGVINSGIGYKDENCTEGVFFEVADAKKFYYASLEVGNHIPLVYGDVYDQLIELSKLMGLEVLTCE